MAKKVDNNTREEQGICPMCRQDGVLYIKDMSNEPCDIKGFRNDYQITCQKCKKENRYRRYIIPLED